MDFLGASSHRVSPFEKVGIIQKACSQVSGPGNELGHGNLKYSVEANVGNHSLTVRYNRFADGCKDPKTLAPDECVHDVSKATNW